MRNTVKNNNVTQAHRGVHFYFQANHVSFSLSKKKRRRGMRKITEEISFYLNVFDDIKMCFRCVEPFSIPVRALKYLDFYYQMSARCVKPYRNRNMFQAFQPLISTNQSFSWAKCSSRGIFDPMVSNIHKNWHLIFLSPYGGVLNSVRSNQCII